MQNTKIHLEKGKKINVPSHVGICCCLTANNLLTLEKSSYREQAKNNQEFKYIERRQYDPWKKGI